MAKTADDYFVDWESHVFGYGYGTGEAHILPALKAFFETIPTEGRSRYDYRVLEEKLGPVVAWLFINALCRADIIEYGTSPRFGWLTAEGERLKKYLAGRTPEQLEEAAGNDERNCYPDYCNCTDGECHNPFWVNRRPPHQQDTSK